MSLEETAVSSEEMAMSSALEAIFRGCFGESHHTELCGGATEPLYQPASATDRLARIHYREDYFSSALHEVAHWCIAGSERRQLEDYGYWYAPDGRSPEQQRRFEVVEVEPQAVEWHFALACGIPFRVSVDNLHGEGSDTEHFTERVREEAIHCIDRGLPPRAEQFRAALAAHFGGVVRPVPGDFD